MTKYLLMFFFSAGQLFRQQKVGHGNETKCFRNQQKQFPHPNKKYFQIPRPKQEKIFFTFLDPNKKNIFRFLDPNKKNIFRFLDPKQKNIFTFLNPNKN